MLKFRSFIIEKTATMTGKVGSPRAEYEMKKYLHPENLAKKTYTLDKPHKNIPAGTKLSLSKVSNVGGVYYAQTTHNGEDHHVPITKIQKPITTNNRGIEYEASFVKHLNDTKLSTSKGAGSGNGPDFDLNSKSGTIRGEAKQHHTKAAFGQATLHHDPAKGGWHISDKTRKKYPEFARYIENAKVGDVPLLQHVNAHNGAPNPENSVADIHSNVTDLSPVHGVMHDKGIDVLHVGNRGTFRTGRSENDDHHKTGLDVPQGTSSFRVRRKDPFRKTLTVQINVHEMNKSRHDIGTVEGANEMKDRLQ